MNGTASRLLSVILIAIGVALVVQTIRHGGGWSLRVGYLVGAGMVVAGCARMWLTGQFRGGTR